jgi:hypothetical protein
LKAGIERRFACLAAVALLAATCGGRSSSAPSSSSSADFQGQFNGNYLITSCVETGVFFSGLCGGTGSTVGSSFALAVSLVQNQSVISGTITLSRSGGTPLTGTFQGAIQSSGHLTAAAPLPPLLLLGTINRDVRAWDSTIAGNDLNGTFTMVHSSNTETGAMTVSATLVQMTRR